MRAPRVSPTAFRRLALLNVVLLVALIVSGAVVRLTNSGLGCADWPNCSATKLVDVSTHHAAIEQLNRIFSGLIGIPLGLGLLAAYWRVPRRRDLVTPSWILFGLFWAEALMGGIAVEVKLAWVSVMGHFLLAIALVSVALLIFRRASDGDAARREYVVSHRSVLLVRAVYALTLWVIIWGTLVTSAGPHGGDATARRLDVPLVDLARVHGASVDILLVLVLTTIAVLVHERAPRSVLNAASITLVVMAAQAALGYVQYFEQIPAVLVGFHVFGAVLVFCAVQYWVLSLRAPVVDVTSEDASSQPLTQTETVRLANLT
jgi:cytochrome c oxidase assembly protein subunit 15